ncbi:thioredoxin domain-containing protein [Propioniciclava soli]|uniref:thioredoxin domain-containing protein n=1 Tax=Propioniciclava soli TaxID=2775081 RepID=UPI001E35FD19|nr:thioredoxin domain-containing protein [Propioniciclava soli]
MTNRLSTATSPYLLQHANNPVDWWPWGEEAFAEARRRDVPVLVSVGYSACHWCHVMAHESFEDADVAALVNAFFVPIKVDREERPDVDAVHMRATQALTGHGGWPMTVFVTPEGEPFFAGTYYPPEPAHGLPSFRQLVTALGEAWRDRRDEVTASASAIVAQLEQINALPPADTPPPVWDLLDAVGADFDVMHGGFGGAPKFPMPLLVDALLVKGEPGLLDLAQRSLEAMARGGIHDQVGGGFHRYAVDAAWVVPHFEKMLYDNALLLGTYARGWRRTPQHEAPLRGLFERVVRGIVGWLEREMLLEGGAFAASLDADSADIRGMAHEGIYYAWNPELLADALGEEDAAWAAEVFHVTAGGTFEHGLSTLQLRGAPDADRLATVAERLAEVRRSRFAPPRDDKVVAAWNGWLVDSLVTGALVFGERRWLELARGAAEYLWSVHHTDAGLVRTSLAGEPSPTVGVAEDHGAVALAFGRLAGVLGESVWLDRAVTVLEEALELFGADDGGFHDAAAGELFSRPRDVTDNPTPSGTMALVAALRLLGELAARPDLLARADAAVATTWGTVAAAPRFAPAALTDLLIADEARQGLRPAVAVVVDADGDPLSDAARAVARMAPAGTVLLVGRPGTTGFAHHFDGRVVRPAAEVAADAGPGTLTHATVRAGGLVVTEAGLAGAGRDEADRDEYGEHEIVALGQTTYVCRGEVCFAPATTVQDLRAALWSRA